MRLDIRFLHILFLSSFLYYGVHILNWSIEWPQIATTIIVCVIVQAAYCLAFKVPINSVMSALITGLGICLLLRSEHIFIFGFTALFAIGSKYLIKFEKHHIFNPTIFGIVLIITLTGQGEISRDFWNNETIIYFGVGSLLILLISRYRKLDLIVYYIVFFVGLLYTMNVCLKGFPVYLLIHDLHYSVFIITVFFLFIEPSTSPNDWKSRLIYSFFIVVITFYIIYFCQINSGFLLAIFALSPIVPILNQWFVKPKFTWDSLIRRTLNTNQIS